MTRSDTGPATARTTSAERAFVLGGLAIAALCTAFATAMGSGMEAIAFIWMAAGAWAFISSLALAIRRGMRHRDWSAFRRCELSDNADTLDWSYGNGIFMGRWYGQPPETLEFCYL